MALSPLRRRNFNLFVSNGKHYLGPEVHLMRKLEESYKKGLYDLFKERLLDAMQRYL